MARSSSHTSDHMTSMCDRLSLHRSLHCMSSVKCQKIIFPLNKIQTCRLRFPDTYLSFATINDLLASCDHIIIRKHTILQCNFYACNRIFHYDLQCLALRLIRIDCRKTRNLIFSIENVMRTVTQITRCTSICIFNDQCRASVISGSIGRILLRKCIHRICSVIPCIKRISRESPVIIRQQIIHAASICFLSIIQVQEEPIRVHLHLIRCILCLYCKCPVCFTVNNSHLLVSFLCLWSNLYFLYFTAPFTTPFKICF